MTERTRTTQTTMTFGYTITVKELKDFLTGLDDDAKVTIKSYAGDQRDPGYSTVTVTKTERY